VKVRSSKSEFAFRRTLRTGVRSSPSNHPSRAQTQARHVTLSILWDEYIARNPQGYRYSRFCGCTEAGKPSSRSRCARPTWVATSCSLIRRGRGDQGREVYVYRTALAAALLSVVVHQAQRGGRSRAAAQSGAASLEALDDPDDGRYLRASVPERPTTVLSWRRQKSCYWHKSVVSCAGILFRPTGVPI